MAIMLIIVFPKVPQLLRVFERTEVLVPHTKPELSIWAPKRPLYQMVVY